MADADAELEKPRTWPDMSSPELELLASNIHYLRRARGLTQSGLGVHSWVSRVEALRQTPSIAMIEKWAERLGVPVADLFAEDAGDWFLRELFAMRMTGKQWESAIEVIKTAAAQREKQLRRCARLAA